MKFLDANIILRFLTQDDKVKARACLTLFQSIRSGLEKIITSESIITEVCYILSSRNNPYKLNHEEIRERLMPIISMRGLKLPNKRMYLKALDIYASFPMLDIEDAISVASMQRLGIKQILSYDTDFDKISEVQRIEP